MSGNESTNEARLLSRFNRNPPAVLSLIQKFEAASDIGLPDDYLEFLQKANGVEGWIGDAYVMLWRVEELLERNSAYRVAEYARGFLLFGSDGGGEAFAFDLRSGSGPIVSVPFIGMDGASATPIAATFKGFLESLSTS